MNTIWFILLLGLLSVVDVNSQTLTTKKLTIEQMQQKAKEGMDLLNQNAQTVVQNFKTHADAISKSFNSTFQNVKQSSIDFFKSLPKWQRPTVKPAA
jgi:CRISPR/Cas system CMR subunit Cmr6 (Cas7 group RAMP superfamily)